MFLVVGGCCCCCCRSFWWLLVAVVVVFDVDVYVVVTSVFFDKVTVFDVVLSLLF